MFPAMLLQSFIPNMAGKSRCQFLAGIPAVLNASVSLQSTAAGNDSNEYVLWYRQPAPAWTHALPIGNGRLGAMVFGGLDTEHLQLNEDSIWSGAPHDWNNPDASAVLPDIRRLVLDDENYHEADALCKKMQGPYNESYQPLGNLFLKINGGSGATDYRRELDLDTAVARIAYRSAGSLFQREMFSSVELAVGGDMNNRILLFGQLVIEFFQSELLIEQQVAPVKRFDAPQFSRNKI